MNGFFDGRKIYVLQELLLGPAGTSQGGPCKNKAVQYMTTAVYLSKVRYQKTIPCRSCNLRKVTRASFVTGSLD